MDTEKSLKDMISECKNIVFFGGAGVSTASGIPDFRSANGLYKAANGQAYPPEKMLSLSFFKKYPEAFYQYYFENLVYDDAKPNAAHYALSKLEAEGKLKAIITQNIDGLHQKAGAKKVYEIHGSMMSNTCMNCGETYSLEALKEKYYCPKCNGLIKPDVTLYEEGLDMTVYNGAVKKIAEADMLIVGGTSLVVYPAAYLVDYFKGRYLILINQTPTNQDSRATVVYRDSIAKVLAEAIQ